MDIVVAGSTQAVAKDIRVVVEDIRVVAGDIRAAAGGIRAVEVDTVAAGPVPAATGRKHIRRTTSETDTLLERPSSVKRLFWT